MSTYFKAKPSKNKTWVSPNPMLGEFQLDQVAISRLYNQFYLKNKDKNAQPHLFGYLICTINCS